VAEKPVAVRIVRPYDTEDDFLDGEIDTLTRTTVMLVGAQKRPDGVVLRFEIALRNGMVLIRGEGRVVAYKENAHQGEPGLLLRFTRLDSKSKGLVDRAATRRDGKRSIRPPPPPPPTPEPAPPSDDRPSAAPEIQVVAESVPNIPVTTSSVEVATPPDRDMILERLRARAKTLDPAQIEAILKARSP
jgi:hypothetical protein